MGVQGGFGILERVFCDARDLRDKAPRKRDVGHCASPRIVKRQPRDPLRPDVTVETFELIVLRDALIRRVCERRRSGFEADAG